MKGKTIIDNLEYIDDKYVIEAGTYHKKKTTKSVWIKLIPVAACFIILCGIVVMLMNYKVPLVDFPISEPAHSETNFPETTTPSPVGGGQSAICPIHGSDGYHTLPVSLIEVVSSNEEFLEWEKQFHIDINSSNKCNSELTITRFIKDFNISKEEFLKNVELFRGDWNVELLYSGTEEKISKYYAEQWANGISNTSKWGHYRELCRKIKRSSPTLYKAKYNYLSSSLPLIVKELEMDRDTLESIIEEIKSEYKYTYDYNLDIIYNKDGTIKDFPRFEGYDDIQNANAWGAVFCSLREPPEQ